MDGRSLRGKVAADESNAAKMDISGNDDCTARIKSRPYWCRSTATVLELLAGRLARASSEVDAGAQLPAALQSRLSGSPQNIWIRERSQRSAGSLSWAPRQAMDISKLWVSRGKSSARRPPAAVKAAAV